jgi:hypothetical protein
MKNEVVVNGIWIGRREGLWDGRGRGRGTERGTGRGTGTMFSTHLLGLTKVIHEGIIHLLVLGGQVVDGTIVIAGSTLHLLDERLGQNNLNLVIGQSEVGAHDVGAKLLHIVLKLIHLGEVGVERLLIRLHVLLVEADTLTHQNVTGHMGHLTCVDGLDLLILKRGSEGVGGIIDRVDEHCIVVAVDGQGVEEVAEVVENLLLSIGKDVRTGLSDGS